MGSECTPDEREFRYLTFYQAIHDIEKDIKKELKNPDMKDKKYSSYALVSQAICNKHKFLLKNEFDKNEARKEVLDYNNLIEKTVHKSYKIFLHLHYVLFLYNYHIHSEHLPTLQFHFLYS